MAGVLAEYERAQIAERCRRGRIYKARQGCVWMSSGSLWLHLYAQNRGMFQAN